MKPVRLLDLGCVSYLRSQAVYHAVAEAMTEGAPDTVILLWPDRPYFCVGFHQDPRQELDLDFCRAQGFPVLRRQVGGGTTYLDAHQLFYQIVLHHSRAPQVVKTLYAHCLGPPIAALRTLGLEAELRGVNEPAVNGRRIAGTGAARIGEASVVVGNVLFDFDYATMARAWRVPSESFRRLAREGLERYLTTLRRELSSPPSCEALKSLLVEQFEAAWGRPLVPGELTAREEALVAETERRLASPEWVYAIEGRGRSTLKIVEGVFVRATTCYVILGATDGALDVAVRVRDGVVDALVLEPRTGFGGPVWDMVAATLVGCPLRREALRERIVRLEQSGVFPFELNLTPLLRSLVDINRMLRS